MIMKNIKYILKYSSILFLLVVMFTCNKLDEYNPSGATNDAIWSTPDGFQTLVNAAYINQRTFYGKEDGVLMAEAGTDIWFRASKSTSYRQLFRYADFSSSSAGTSTNYWRDIWPAINYCNAGIGRIGNVSFSSEVVKKQKEGELRFLRAFYYWHIVETYGGVSLRTTETTTPVLTAERSSVKDFYNLIITDLDSAVTWLPKTPVNPKEYSRATKKSAMGLLARALLSRAYYSIDEGNSSEAATYFTLAKQIAHTTIDSAVNWGISLYPNYSDLWNNAVGGNNKNSKEALYIISNSTNYALNYDANGNRLHLWFLAKYSDKPGMQQDLANGNDGYRYFMPTEFLLDLFDESKDSRYSATFQDIWKANKTAAYTWTASDATKYGKVAALVGQKINPGDTAFYITKNKVPDKSGRKYVVIDRDSLFRADTIYSITDAYPALKKFMDPNRTAANAQPGYNDILVIRLAEMYMIAAEAEFQLGDNTSAANDINVIRRRASKTHTGDMDVVPGDVTLDFILDERAREFAGEHMRWFDLKRTRTLAQRVQKYNKNVQIPDNLLQKGNGVFENMLLRPVPQTELDALLNGAEFGQNPGY